MFVVRTVENLANSVGKLVCSEKSVGFDHLALCVNPLRFDGVQPRALLRKQATDDPYSLTALFDSAVVGTEPTPHFFGDVPRSVVPDENENLLANGLELSHAPLEKARRYRRNRPPVHEPDPRPIESGQVESVTAYGFRSFAGSSLATDRWMRRGGLPSSAQALSVGRATRLHQHSSKKPTAHSGSAPATSISRSRRLFSFVQGVGGGYPPLRSHPANPEQARKRRPHRLPRDALFGESLFEGRL